ncbi:Mur ligase [Pholiota molesta]|nr:Mur ligase [Pholiota molesta]
MSIDLSLDRLQRLVTHLRPYTRPTIHIAGTNGKGSVSALLTSILLASHPVESHEPLRVGRYNSPHLISILDCITIDNKPISRSLYDETRKEVEEADQEHATHLSNFELLTLTALLAFERLNVDIVILEVGMGGRLDATNIVPTSCILASALTAVDLIIRQSRDREARKALVLGNQAHPEVNEVVKEVVEGIGGLLFRRSGGKGNDGGFPALLADRFNPLRPANYSPHALLSIRHTPSRVFTLHGAHQLDNLAAALGVLNALLTRDLDDGIQNTSWPGRLSFHTSPQAQEANRVDTLLVLADGAHNPASAETLGAYIKSLLEATTPVARAPREAASITYVLGLSHSPPKTPLQTLGPWHAVGKPVPTPSMRAAVRSLLPGLTERDIWTPVDVGAEAPGDGGRNRALADALRWAAGRHAALVGDGEDGERLPGLVVLAGSLYLVADFYRLIEGGTLGA